jgi:UDP-N-acetylmuramyl pentapeptide synthase
MLASKLLKDEYNLDADIEITGIVYDSRQTVAGNVFVCIKGYEQDGHKYAKMAEEMGAALIVAEDEVDVIICCDLNQIYLFPFSEVKGKRNIYLRDTPPKNGQLKGINFTKDYIISEDRISKVFTI